MRRVFAVIIALVTGANGVAMLVDPAGWFTRVPGAVATGPFNSHFVLDVGIAFIVAGGAVAVVGMKLVAGQPSGGRPVVERLDPALDEILLVDATLDVIKQDYFGAAEGPTWVSETGGGYLAFSDMGADRIYKWGGTVRPGRSRGPTPASRSGSVRCGPEPLVQEPLDPLSVDAFAHIQVAARVGDDIGGGDEAAGETAAVSE